MIELDGASKAQLRKASRALHGADAKIRREVEKAHADAVRPVESELRASALATLPRRGGLAARVAKVKVRAETSGAGSQVVTTLIAGLGNSRLGQLDAGQVTHPTYGRRPLVRQSIQAGFASKVMRGPVARRAEAEHAAALRRVAQDIAQEAS